ncbi:hypothetical protein TNCV_892121 [Trichonephila clavipes]|nr:hypothetical protein TNCV_892121 [Trichonephila clavipes]
MDKRAAAIYTYSRRRAGDKNANGDNYMVKRRKEICQTGRVFRCTPVDGRSLAHLTGGSTIFLAQSQSNLEEEHPRGGSGASHLSFPTTSFTRGPVTRRLIRVLPCRKGNIHLQTSSSSAGSEPRPYATAVNVANHYTG